MKISLVTSSLSIGLLIALVGCSGSESAPVTDAPAPTASEEAELRSPSFSGMYGAASSDDDQYFGTIKVSQHGSKLVLELDGTSYDLTKTRSGAYVFTSGDLNNECDDPGCYNITKVSGVVYLKKVGNAKKPTVKLSVKLDYPYPEYEGDLEGEQTTTLHWYKKR